MNLKRLTTLSDQFPYCVSPRRKVVSRFVLGILAFFIILSLLLFNVSFKTPFSNPFFQGFNRFGANSNTTSLIPWHFPFSTTTSAYSSSSNSSSNANVDATEFQNPLDLVESGKYSVLNNNHEGNSSVIGNSGKSLGAEGNLINCTAKALEANGAESGRSGKILDSAGKGMDLEKTHLSNSTENVKNGSFGVIIENAIEGKLDWRNSSGISSIVNITANGGEILFGKDNATISSSGSFRDLFNGRWVRDDSKPYYPAGSCPHIDRDFDCHLNKRPDEAFVKWKWQPYGCDIPSLNATDFLVRLRGKKLVFVGDSLNRNMWESLVCILRQSIKDKKRVYEISGRREFKKKGFYAFRFEDYNCTVDFVSSPFLVRESSFSGKNGSFETLRLDLMDKTTSMYNDADILIFNTGHWWTHEKTSKGIWTKMKYLLPIHATLFSKEEVEPKMKLIVLLRKEGSHARVMRKEWYMYFRKNDVLVYISRSTHGNQSDQDWESRPREDYYQEGAHVFPRLKVLDAYTRALTTWARWVDKNIDASRTQVIFRGYSVTHFRGGPWNSGGQCHKETEPIFNTTHLAKYPSKMRAFEYVLRDMKTPIVYLNISRLTDYRKDAHPSIYRMEYKTVEEQIAAVHSQDCSHWCLPGVPDTWNELLYASLLKVGRGSWKN